VSYALLAADVAMVLAFLVFTHKEREGFAQVLGEFVRDAHEREQALLQRIQAPDSEVVRYFYDQGEQHNPPALRSDDEPGADEDWQLARVDKEDLARVAAEEELSRG
jgi:hypothetical protein